MKRNRKILALILCVTMLLTCAPLNLIASAAQTADKALPVLEVQASVLEEKGLDPEKIDGRLMGDFNNDRVISAWDARVALRYSARLETFLNAEQLFVIDINQDEIITAADARMILRMSAKLEIVKEIYVVDGELPDNPELIDSEKDSDGDKVPDYEEDKYGSDKYIVDTDNDGINDYIEIYEIKSNPTINDSSEDYDSDNISNYDEVNLYKTSPAKSDSDEDALTDYDEINIYKTDPNKWDTDEDGVSDGKEIELGTNPLEFETDFEVTYTSVEEDTVDASVKINLSGEQVETFSIEKIENETLFPETIPGYIGGAYDFSVDGQFDRAIISFEFDERLLDDEDFDPVIYYYNEAEQSLEALETTVTGNVASAETTHFSTYILINRKLFEKAFIWEEVWEESAYDSVEIVFVIDDSGSMQSNDKNNQRLTVAADLIDRLPDQSKIGIVNFTESVSLLTSSLIDNKNDAKAYLTTSHFSSYGGTSMYRGINKAFDLFESDDSKVLKLIVALSDGETDDTGMASSVISTAVSKNIKVYTVGLGSNASYYFNSYLKPLAEQTGASFYLASDSSQLTSIYDNIGKKIERELDSDKDGIPDWYEENVICFNGTEIIMDKYSADTDGDGLLDGEEVKLVFIYNDAKTKVKVYGRLKSNPNDKDSDNDGIYDCKDTAPFVLGLKNGVIGKAKLFADTRGNGHAFVTFTSYVNMNLYISNASKYCAYNGDKKLGVYNEYKNFNVELKPNTLLTFGMLTTGPWSESSADDGEVSGFMINAERANGAESYYRDRVSVEEDITLSEVYTLLKPFQERDYYNVITNNCATVATIAWNNTFGTNYSAGFAISRPDALAKSLLSDNDVKQNAAFKADYFEVMCEKCEG